jgi:hypothetical protein
MGDIEEEGEVEERRRGFVCDLEPFLHALATP